MKWCSRCSILNYLWAGKSRCPICGSPLRSAAEFDKMITARQAIIFAREAQKTLQEVKSK